MKKSVFSLLIAAAVLIQSGVTSAQDKGGKKSPSAAMVTQFMKQLEKAELPEEMSAKVKETFAKVAEEVSSKRTAAGITAEMLKKRTEAQKAAKAEGKKPKEAQAAVEAAMGLTAEQSTVFKDTEAMLSKVRVEIGKMLTPEQIAKLPENAQGAFKEKAGKGKKAAQ
jgi:phosphate-selective porin